MVFLCYIQSTPPFIRGHMQGWQRILRFLILNVIVSALTTWAVVSVMMRNQAALPDPAAVSSSPEGLLATLGETLPGEEAAPAEPAAGDMAGDLLTIDSVIGAGVLEAERVLIQHVGEKEVSLVGWKLQDQDGNVFNFPTLTMFQGGAVTVYTRVGTSTVVELYWGQEEPIWQVGEKASLIDPTGQTRAVYTVP
jgi:hypothetical protein